MTTLTLGLVPEGSGNFYPTPELAFLRDETFCQAEADAREWIIREGLQDRSYDVRWQLRRNDSKALVNLIGPSMGAAFALGMAKLLVGEPE